MVACERLANKRNLNWDAPERIPLKESERNTEMRHEERMRQEREGCTRDRDACTRMTHGRV